MEWLQLQLSIPAYHGFFLRSAFTSGDLAFLVSHQPLFTLQVSTPLPDKPESLALHSWLPALCHLCGRDFVQLWHLQALKLTLGSVSLYLLCPLTPMCREEYHPQPKAMQVRAVLKI